MLGVAFFIYSIQNSEFVPPYDNYLLKNKNSYNFTV